MKNEIVEKREEVPELPQRLQQEIEESWKRCEETINDNMRVLSRNTEVFKKLLSL